MVDHFQGFYIVIIQSFGSDYIYIIFWLLISSQPHLYLHVLIFRFIICLNLCYDIYSYVYMIHY